MAEANICPICTHQIKDMLTSIREQASGKPAHFDCVVKRLRTEKGVGGRQKVYYLGGGSFGIVTEKRSRGRFDLEIRDRIQYEPRRGVKMDDHDEEEE